MLGIIIGLAVGLVGRMFFLLFLDGYSQDDVLITLGLEVILLGFAWHLIRKAREDVALNVPKRPAS